MVKFVPIKIAKTLRERSFTEPCIACYDGSDMLATYSSVFKPLNYNVGGAPTTSAPTYEEVKDWLRDNHNIHININPQHDWVSELELTCGSFPNGKYSGTLDDVTLGKEMIASDTICLIPSGDDYYKAFDNAIEAALEQI